MKATILIIAVLIVVGVGYVLLRDNRSETDGLRPITEAQREATTSRETDTARNTEEVFGVTPIAHATMVLETDDGTVLYTDPVGGEPAFRGQPEPDIILVTDIHSDHLDLETLDAVTASGTVIVAPAAVAEQFPERLMAQTEVMANGDTIDQEGITITAVPMYNLPEQGIEIRHEKGRGNGYLLEYDGERVYIAGDTAGIPEMRALTDIDKAFIPMNLPYTMSVEDAAEAVLAFAPAQVYPYHYRTPEGFSDIEHFRELVREGNPDIDVELLEWYPDEASQS